MADQKPLSNDEVHTLLYNARLALGDGRAQTVVGNTSLQTARSVLSLLAFGVIEADAKGSDQNPAIKAPEQPAHEPKSD